MKKKLKLPLLLVTIVLVACNSDKKNEEEKKVTNQQPNIIYILSDDLGFGDVQSFNSNGKIPTPNLNEMANNGVRFTDAHTSSAVCTPTRYSIITGRYNWRTSLKQGVVSGYSKSLIKPERTTVANMLKQQGYTTAFIGKWHMGWDWDITKKDSLFPIDNLKSRPEVNFNTDIKNGPTSHGFDYSFGFCGSLDMPPYVYVENNTPTMAPTKTTISVDDKGVWRKGLTSDDFEHASVLQDLTDRAVNYIEEKSKGEEPFFLYFPLPAPHTPILPSTEFLGKSNTNMYGDFVMQVDDVVRQIRETLKKQGISENTMVVFTSDNGCSPKANFKELAKVDHDPSYEYKGMKSDLYEGGHRVPFIVEWPNKVLKNAVNSSIICTTDFFATCAAITGYKTKDDEGEDSYSMLPLLTGESKTEVRDVIVHHSVDGSFAIRQGDWKLLIAKGSAGWSYPTNWQINNQKLDLPDMQLYNLKDDIGETKNLIAENPEKATALKNTLKKLILEGRSTPGAEQQNDAMEGWKQIETIIN
jgi:arylsulfatase A-like enzyme